MEQSEKIQYRIESSNHRCAICNSVSYEDIATNLGDYNPHTYFASDPDNDLHFICGECTEAIQELREDYEWDDFFDELEELDNHG